ncbi:UPF0042 nucleotide-binding protein [Alkalispirillum mobile]|uniref:UPF0042 nucleotide-binding protein n=1 Tax=Alkalispirillum mobile TaxID=85925 RepID=A0A498BQ62_9GAMM|nr:RNase adapter RapZ [Alkalispirillum mobile]RLK46274.1 UPF0042 nucleotide-binding protein [Alkalispirillum mobile]
MQNLRLIIISGLSGSGKSVALHTLEDQGWYCIDNLPVGLLSAFARHVNDSCQGASGRYAVGIDARNRPEDLARIPEILDELGGLGLNSEVLFLFANHETLITRFSETRRRHPLSGDDATLADAIAREETLLAPLRARADLTLDTSDTNVHQLRDLIRERVEHQPGRLSLLFQSFGYKHGIPSDADYVFDARCLPNPHWEPRLRPFTGQDAPVQSYLEAQPEVGRLMQQIEELVSTWLPAFRKEARSYVTVAIGCTGGQHRSVYLAEQLARRFDNGTDAVSVRHRELSH